MQVQICVTNFMCLPFISSVSRIHVLMPFFFPPYWNESRKHKLSCTWADSSDWFRSFFWSPCLCHCRWRSHAKASRSVLPARCRAWWTCGCGERREGPSKRRCTRRPRSLSWCWATAAASELRHRSRTGVLQISILQGDLASFNLELLCPLLSILSQPRIEKSKGNYSFFFSVLRTCKEWEKENSRWYKLT